MYIYLYKYIHIFFFFVKLLDIRKKIIRKHKKIIKRIIFILFLLQEVKFEEIRKKLFLYHYII